MAARDQIKLRRRFAGSYESEDGRFHVFAGKYKGRTLYAVFDHAQKDEHGGPRDIGSGYTLSACRGVIVRCIRDLAAAEGKG